MKLYTEEQLKEAFFEGINYAKSITPSSMGFIEQYVAKKINLITPIELPNDEEIEEDMKGQSGEYACGWEDAFNWMKEQILNKNK